MNNTTVKNWVDLMPEAGVYLVNNIKFTKDGKSIEDCLHATQFDWKQLLAEAVDPVAFDNENDTLLAYYRMQAFLYYDCTFDTECVRPGTALYDHLIAVNNLIEIEQPYNYSFDLGPNYQTTDELVEFMQPEYWFAVIPDGYENCLTYVKTDVERKALLHQAVYEYLINTLPVNIFTKTHHCTRTLLTNPNLLDDLIGFDDKLANATEEEFKRFVVNNAFAMPETFLYEQYKAI